MAIKNKNIQKKIKSRVTGGKDSLAARAAKVKMPAKGKKVGGGKLSRSEVVQVRLDPRLRFSAELAAKKHRRTLSSFAEWAIEEAISKVMVGLSQNETAKFVMNEVWDVSEPKRFLNLAHEYPFLLTHDEEVLFSRLQVFDSVWMLESDVKKYDRMSKENYKSLFLWKLEHIWSEFKRMVREEDSPNLLSLKEKADEVDF
jgi:hypothetical protein